MTALTKFLDLLVTEGPDIGMRFSIEQCTFRIIGKREAAEENSILNLNQHEIVNQHIRDYSDFASLQFEARGPDILLSDSTLNRVHAIFLFDEKMASCADLTGTSSVFLQNDPIKEKKLQNHDIITIGNTKLKVLL